MMGNLLNFVLKTKMEIPDMIAIAEISWEQSGI